MDDIVQTYCQWLCILSIPVYSRAGAGTEESAASRAWSAMREMYNNRPGICITVNNDQPRSPFPPYYQMTKDT